MPVRVEYPDAGPFERDQAQNVLMRRPCVGALVHDLTNARAGRDNEAHGRLLTWEAGRCHECVAHLRYPSSDLHDDPRSPRALRGAFFCSRSGSAKSAGGGFRPPLLFAQTASPQLTSLNRCSIVIQPARCIALRRAGLPRARPHQVRRLFQLAGGGASVTPTDALLRLAVARTVAAGHFSILGRRMPK